MIEIRNLSKSYGKKKVLDKLNCNIKTGSIYGLIGANGAGKSTLLRIINDVFKRDEGTVLVNEEEVENNQELKQKLVFVPDDLFFYPSYTLKEIKNFPLLSSLSSILPLNISPTIAAISSSGEISATLIIFVFKFGFLP